VNPGPTAREHLAMARDATDEALGLLGVLDAHAADPTFILPRDARARAEQRILEAHQHLATVLGAFRVVP
jgi:hypothetical protein